MNYKETLLMPETSFQMRGNLPENEKLQREKWEEMDLYNKVREKNKGKTPFILHDGPPYANGNIHIGHAMNKILKDFVNRYKMMSGYDMIYIPGWDTHGLPIEQAVTNSGIDRKSMGKADFRSLCEKYAYEQIEKQMSGFKELNVLADWAHPYITLQKEMEARQIEVFAEMAKKGLIFKGLKPVYWSPSSESALAEAEIEYHDRKDPSIFVAFPVVEGNDKVKEGDNLVIWTTTPWTLPCNTGIAISDKFDYAKVLVGDKYYIVANELLDSLAKEFNWENYEVVDVFSGSEFKGVKYKHVFMDRVAPVVDGFHVTLDAGTGLVHIAPMYGADDFIIGKEYGLEMVNGIDDQGVLNELSGPFNGLFFEDANKAVTVKLEELGVLLKLKFITHSYPHDWRTKKPIIFRATKQWFCSIDKIRDELLNELENNVKFHTEWGKKRLYNMIHDRGDWCISRQRVWGVPIPIFYNEDGSEIIDYDVMMHVADLFRKYGSNVWFEREAKDLLPEGYKNPASPNGNFTKEEDIMDVWFDSGSTHQSVLVERGLPYPADMYLEGNDQYRGWFQSSLLTSVATNGIAPYKQVLTHGFVTDGQGRKMSKSLGNGVAPSDVANKFGADILRLWALSSDYTGDVSLSDDILKQSAEVYRKIRNTARYILGNTSDYNPDEPVEYKDLEEIDKWALTRLNKLIKDCTNNYDNYNFSNCYHDINQFCVSDMSNFYLDIIKDRLYTSKPDSKERRSAQTTMYIILDALVKILTPMICFTAEEIWKAMKHKSDEQVESVMLTDFPKANDMYDNEELSAKWDKILKLKDLVAKELENARAEKTIGHSLNAKVTIFANDDEYNFLKENIDLLRTVFIISDLEVLKNERKDEEKLGIKVEQAHGEKCERCWMYSTTVGEDKENPTICHRCSEALK